METEMVNSRIKNGSVWKTKLKILAVAYHPASSATLEEAAQS
jgi:hypothetical protein